MPIQSKRISLTALGIHTVPGMEDGNHLRVGFDPRMGFPPCGFRLYRRAHETGETVALDLAACLTNRFLLRCATATCRTALRFFIQTLRCRKAVKTDSRLETKSCVFRFALHRLCLTQLLRSARFTWR